MTNYEHYKEQIEKITRLGFTFALNKDTEEIVACPSFSCNNCIFKVKFFNGCAKEKLEWADNEYIEPEIDWLKVAVNTQVLVSDYNKNWYRRHFAKYENGLVCAWDAGKTSYTTDVTTYWEYAKLAEVDNRI